MVYLERTWVTVYFVENKRPFRHRPASARTGRYWAGPGLTAYDACDVALAEERRTVLITADACLPAVAGPIG
jgi:hypothetical protein